jgi:glucokinase
MPHLRTRMLYPHGSTHRCGTIQRMINTHSIYAACIDIGGTKTAVSIVDSHGWRARLIEPSASTGASDALPRQIVQMVDHACAQAGIDPHQVTTAGVASCGPFVVEGGALSLAAPNLCGGLAGAARGLANNWQSIPLAPLLSERFACLEIENDAVAALVAERRWGALAGLDHCAYVTWSTGIGVGLCVDGHILRGKNGNAGHAGHMFTTVIRDSALCGCGNVGDVEGTCGGLSLSAAAGMPVAELFARAQAGEAHCAAIVDHAIETFAKMLFNLFATLDLQRIAIGGSIFARNAPWLLPRLHAALPTGLRSLMDNTTVVAAGLGERVGDFAALALVAGSDWRVTDWPAPPLSKRPARTLA